MHKIYDLPTRSEQHRKLRLEIIELYKSSNLARGDFCRHHGIKPDDISNWATRLGISLAKSPENIVAEKTEPANFVPLDTLDDSSKISIEIYNKFSVNFSCTNNINGVIKLIQELSKIC